MTKEEIQVKIDKNRDLIDRALSHDVSLEFKYFLIRDLSKRNEKLIEQLNSTDGTL